MTLRLPFRNLQPNFCAGLFDDPLLLVRQRPLGSNLLFDCGQLHHLAKRSIAAIEAVFVSHLHMDHWMGIDTLTRHVYVAPKQVQLFGPPGIAARLEAKLAGYEWNLCEPDWGSYLVHEIHQQRIVSHLLSGPDGYRRSELGVERRHDQTIFENHLAKVQAQSCDHLIPSLIYRIDEQPAFLLQEGFLERHGLLKGHWLKQLKKRFYRREELDAPLAALRQGANGAEEVTLTNVRQLCDEIGAGQQPAAIGYVSDVGFTPENRAKIVELLQGVTLLLCETTFLRDGLEKARASRHLCSADVNLLLDQLRPQYFLPMHLSKSYSRCSAGLYRELEPPSGTTLLQLPDLVTPAPLQQQEFPWRELEEGE